ncbi:MAG TPA: hypothetical protein DCW52_06080 [Gammaproteobacteria bacterium]|mgnify:CR=1 FL=1|nr:hypothetical protein [Gammaproteobacteria bacterium]
MLRQTDWGGCSDILLVSSVFNLAVRSHRVEKQHNVDNSVPYKSSRQKRSERSSESFPKVTWGLHLELKSPE